MTTFEITTLIFSGIVTLSTGVYVYLTRKLVNETRKMREFQITPDISIYLDRSETDVNYIYLVIENNGLGIAENVCFEILKDYQYYKDDHFKLENKGIIKRGIEKFYSKQKFRFFFANITENHELKMKSILQLKITYNDINYKEYVKNINLILDEYSGLTYMVPPDSYVGRIAYELKEIKRILTKN